MVERLAQRVGIVPVVGLQCLAERVAFRLEHQPGTVIVRQCLDERAGTAVGRNDKGEHGHILLFAAVRVCQLQSGSSTQFRINGRNQFTAQSQCTLAHASICGNKQIQVGIDNALVIDSAHLVQCGRENRNCPNQQHVPVRR